MSAACPISMSSSISGSGSGSGEVGSRGVSPGDWVSGSSGELVGSEVETGDGRGRPPRLIGHVDADCFYVSAERARDDFLRGKPVGVLGNQGACVIAKSYEMKAAGVSTGAAIWDALAVCPSGVYLKRDFRWYEVLSRRMLEVMRGISRRVEYYSIDEFFFVAEPRRGESFEGLARRVRDALWGEAGVPATVGLARTRTLAKLLSDTAKPFGAAVALDRREEEGLLGRTPVTEIAGIAGRRAARLRPWGVSTCLDFARLDRGLARSLLTSAGEGLWWELRGEPVFPIRTEPPARKTLSRGGSFGGCTADPGVVLGWLARNVERLVEELEYHRLLAGELTVWVGLRDGGGGEGRSIPEVPTDRFDLLMDAGRDCLSRAWRAGRAANRMHVIATRLRPRREAQMGLFDDAADRERARRVGDLKREVNGRMGRFALRSGATLALSEVYADAANGFDICDIRGKMCF